MSKISTVAEELNSYNKNANKLQSSYETVVYIGPTIQGVIFANTIFNRGLPNEVNNFVKQHPVVKNLQIPVEQLAIAKKDLNTKDSVMQIFFHKVKEISAHYILQ